MNWKQHATPAELERLDYIDNAAKQQSLAATAERRLIYNRCVQRAKRSKAKSGKDA